MLWKVLPRQSDDLFEHLLISRGIKTEKQKEEFFNPKLESFEKILQIPGMADAKKRIEKAIKEQELIIAYGDYDVDGICGAGILYLGLTAMGAKVLPYIPHREKEGYGLSKVGLDFARDSGAALVITTDCGIVNFEEAKYASSIGLELVVTDHHQLDKRGKPKCLSVIHCTDMCGAAVAWCLIRFMAGPKKAEELLDLAAIATISDMMPLVGVNRAFVKLGLEKLNKTLRVGLTALLNEAGVKLGSIGSYEIGHIIAPRLNAMGRLEHAIDSLRLLCTKDPIKARRLADLIADANNQRKTLTLKAVEEAKLLVKTDSKIHVLHSSDWVPGIIGLVAGRISEETRIPSIAISVGPVHSKGSARSGGKINIVEILRKCSDMLVAVGGHPGAAGFTIESTRIEEFKVRLSELVDGEMIVEEPVLDIDAKILSKELSLKLAKNLNTFEPFGISNPKPIFVTNNMKLSNLRTVGEGKHLKGKADNIDFIAFSKGPMLDILQNGQLINLAYNLEIDTYGGYEKLQLKVKDIVS
jgi:single-stranded-DNA-specific exonuclease